MLPMLDGAFSTYFMFSYADRWSVIRNWFDLLRQRKYVHCLIEIKRFAICATCTVCMTTFPRCSICEQCDEWDLNPNVNFRFVYLHCLWVIHTFYYTYWYTVYRIPLWTLPKWKCLIAVITYFPSKLFIIQCDATATQTKTNSISKMRHSKLLCSASSSLYEQWTNNSQWDLLAQRFASSLEQLEHKHLNCVSSPFFFFSIFFPPHFFPFANHWNIESTTR